MLYLLLILMSMAPVHNAYSMLSTPLQTCPAVSTSSFNAIQNQEAHCIVQSTGNAVSSATLTIPEIENLPLNIRATIIRDDVLKAVNQGQTETVIAAFSGWMNWMMPREYYRVSVAYTLHHAARKSPKVTGAIVRELLERVHAADIVEPDKLLFAAMDNNHIAILEYMQNAEPTRMAGLLAWEILGGNPNRVQALLKAGVQAVNNPHLKQPYVLLQIALDSFALGNQKVSKESRLAVITTLLKHVDTLPASQAFDMNYVPEHLVGRIAKSIKSKQPVVQSNLEEESEASLHKAAKNNDYNACLAMLTAFQGPMIEANYFPHDAMNVQRTKYADFNSPEMVWASRKMSQYMVQMKKLMDTRQEIARKIRLEKNQNGLTAQEVAIAAKASKELIDLLDPENKWSLADILMKNIVAQAQDKPEPFYAPKHVFNQKPQAQPSPEGMSLGTKITINGKEYVITSKKKVT